MAEPLPSVPPEETAYFNKTFRDIVYDFGKVRGDLSEEYARDQMVFGLKHSREMNFMRGQRRTAHANWKRENERYLASQSRVALQTREVDRLRTSLRIARVYQTVLSVLVIALVLGMVLL